MKNRALLALLSLVSLPAFACGSTVVEEKAPGATTQPTDPTPAPTTTTTPTKPATPPLDHGAVSTNYPAFPPAVGQLVTNGGQVLKNPVFVTVTWSGDADADQLEAFGDALGGGAYWKAVTAEYGAAAGVSGAANHVRLTDAAPATMSDTQLDSFVSTSLADPATVWPKPATGNPVYILYLPTTTALTLQGQNACDQGVGGYHSNTKSGIAYAIVPRCGNDPVEVTTLSASHELAEATTDPYPQTSPAYSGFRDQDLAWEFFQQFQSENGDACEFYKDSALAAGSTDVGFVVQRQWSNVSGAAGHDPCVPMFKGETYFNVTPINPEDITVDLSPLGGDSAAVTKGFKVKVGATRKIPLGFYSDGPTTSWSVTAAAGGIAGGHSSSSIDLELDVDSGQNGQKAYLSVTVNTPGRTNAELITIVSTQGQTSHYMPILIGN